MQSLSSRTSADRHAPPPVPLGSFAIFTVLKAGFVWSGKAGSGVVIARLPDGTWSAPSCIATGGVGFGLQIGADLSEVSLDVRRESSVPACESRSFTRWAALKCNDADPPDDVQFVVVLNSDEALSAFAKGGNLTIGGSLAAAAGPIGVGGAVNTAILNPAPMFTYSKSKGLYAGVSLEGTVLVERVRSTLSAGFSAPSSRRGGQVLMTAPCVARRKTRTRRSTARRFRRSTFSGECA